MSKDIKIIQVQEDFKVWISFNEVEARAMHDIVGYGADSFLKVFKEKLGSHYINKHEKGLLTFFERLREELPRAFHKIETAQKALNDLNS